MKPRAFISHNDDRGGGVVKAIRAKLTGQELKIDTFLSTRIPPAKNFVKEIIDNLARTDMMFFVVDTEAANSRWMEWEYVFSQKRKIPITCVKFPNANMNDPRLHYIDRQSVWIGYDDYEKDALCDKIHKTVTADSKNMMRRAQARESTLIVLDHAPLRGRPPQPLTISGCISGHTHNDVQIYLHVPSSDTAIPPSTTAMPAFTIGADGRFSRKLRLPRVQPGATSREWYVEIRAEPAACVVPLHIDMEKLTAGQNAAPPGAGRPAGGAAARVPNQMRRRGRDMLEATPLDAGARTPPCPQAPGHQDGGAGGDYTQLLAAASEGAMAGLPQTAMGITIGRKSQVRDVELLLGRRGRAVILGDKGSGKSVLLCQLYKKVAGERAALFVNCEDLQGMESAEEMSAAVLPDGLDLLGTLSRLQRDGRRPVVILDSLDAVGRNERAMRAFKRLLGHIWSQKVSTVATVRRYDYEYSEIIGATDWGDKYDMPLLTVEEVNRALEGAAVTDATPTERSLIANPLNLHLFLQVADVSRGKKRSKISREIDLYDAHWHHYVERTTEPQRVRAALYGIAEGMCAERRTTANIDSAEDCAAVDVALKQGVLVRKKYDQMGFFHPAYMDYAMSRSLLARRASLTDLTRRDEYNMFLRPTLALTLEMALLRDEGEASKTLEDMLRSGLKHAWKVLAAQALAGVRGCRHERFERVGSALTDNDMLQRHFVAELKKQGNLFWLEAWGGTFIAGWASTPNNPNAVLITEYLRAAAAADPRLHGLIFAIARLIADNNIWDVAKRKAVEVLGGVDAAGKAEWLEKMSLHPEPHVRTGVMHNIEALLARDREAVPRIFANLFTYEETSAEKTMLAQIGPIGLGSNKVQDNWLIRYELCSLFPSILEKDAPTAARAAILVHERNHAPRRGAGPGALVDDGGFEWSRLGVSDGDEADEKTLAASLAAHLGRCSGDEFRELAPLLGGTGIATFRSMLIDGMLQRRADYMEGLAAALSDPSTYEAQTLRGSAKNAIKEVSGLLPDAELGRILAAVMASNPPEDGTGEAVRRSEAARAAFLGQLPRGRPGPDHAALVERSAARAPPVPDPPLPPSLEFEEMEEPRRPPLGEDGPGAALARLEAASERLGARPGAVDGASLDEIERLLIECKDDPDPAASVEDERGSPMLVRPSVRGTAAACLARLLSHRKSRRASAALAELSDDPVNLVRGDVSRALGRLLGADRPLALRIALKYSLDPDPRPRYFLHGALPGIAAASPPDASAIIRNMLSMGGGDARILAEAIAHLALERRDPLALEMLGKVADGKGFAEPLRAAVPRALRGRLAGQEGRDEALDILYRMLRDDPSPAVRQKAALFALNWLDTEGGPGGRGLAQKCAPHLELMASMMAEPPFDSFVAESMVAFLERHWSAVPRTALLCLEAVAGDPGGRAAGQPALADASARVLAGLLQYRTMSDGDWRRCVDILDAYAAVGWPAAVKLLSEMERPG